MQMLHGQLEASEKFKTEYQKLYEDAINDLNKVSECYKSCITELAKKCSLLEERFSHSLEMLDSAKQESLEWRRKYEETWNNPWNGVNEFKANIEKDNIVLEYSSEDVNCREEALRADQKETLHPHLDWFGDTASSETDKEKNSSPAILVIEIVVYLCGSASLYSDLHCILKIEDKEIKVKIAKLEVTEQKITTLNLHLKGVQEKMDKYELESSALKLQLKDLNDKYQSVQTAAHALEMAAQIRYWCKVTAEEVKVADKFAETSQSEDAFL
ncbi:hypothetical protein SADUNF_Sadunf17G0088900 [Salix dunnii]|uniref:Uncharacterized protein n=1 Tax=Salix dunnii TaxID=1413687 RepID=A0A835J5B0_9ROSI|nr:hypothetical protein SADUNF_Sadunf17G0088900 [Salix dunnii]